jgi:5-methyltetrahydropteroyltriglutamate--homocysteine methyltransferase
VRGWEGAVDGSRNKPPFRADHVGSLLRPKRLFAARAAWRAGTLAQAELEELEDECVRSAVAMQEGAGLHSITDGDFRRDDWFLDFMFSLEGITRTQEHARVPFSGGVDFFAPLGRVTGKVRCPAGGIMVEDFRFLKSIVSQTPKICIPAPAMFYTVIGPASVDSAVYPDLREFWRDLGTAYQDAIGHLAAAGCTYLQIDDVNSANIADPNWQGFWRSRGLDPEKLVDTFIELNNLAVGQRPRGVTAVIHMCRGNYQSQWAAQGGYDMVAERYFSQSAVDGFFLEYDDQRSGDFAPLRHMPADKRVVLGLMTSKHAKLEPRDEIRRRVDSAAKYIPLERLCLSPQCGFASTQEGNKLSEDEQRAKLTHLVSLAEEIWGSA